MDLPALPSSKTEPCAVNLLCCIAPGHPRLDLFKHLIMTGVSCPDMEFFDDLAALDARLTQGSKRDSHHLAVIAPGPGEEWEPLLANNPPGPRLDLIVILPEAGRGPGSTRYPSNVTLVSDHIHPLLLISYLTSVVALLSGQGRQALVLPGAGTFSQAL